MGNPYTLKNKVVLVPFPFDDFSSTKVRPALCLTTEIGDYNHVIIAFISSKVPEKTLDSDIIINISDKEFAGTGLMVNSVIKLHKLVTIPGSLIKRKLGEIDNNLEIEVKKRLSMLFDI